MVLAFEERVVRPVIETTPDLLELHRVQVRGAAEKSPEYRGKYPLEKPVDDLLMTISSPHPAGAKEAYADRLLAGDLILATSQETFRRVLAAHGVFLWQIKYRLGSDATTVHAHPVAAFMMADRKPHLFHARFVAGELDTTTDRVTPDMVRDSILALFRYYEDNATAEHPAPLPAGWLETGKVPGMPWHDEWWTSDVR
jgi:hypothetical protein